MRPECLSHRDSLMGRTNQTLSLCRFPIQALWTAWPPSEVKEKWNTGGSRVFETMFQGVPGSPESFQNCQCIGRSAWNKDRGCSFEKSIQEHLLTLWYGSMCASCASDWNKAMWSPCYYCLCSNKFYPSGAEEEIKFSDQTETEVHLVRLKKVAKYGLRTRHGVKQQPSCWKCSTFITGGI